MQGRFEGKRILVVEDEALIAMMLTADLEELGFAEVQLAATVAAAIMSVRTSPPDVALLDLRVTDGHTGPVAAALSAAGVPFVLMSGDPAGAAALGFSEPVMGKPFAPAQLHAALNQAFA